MSNAVQSWVDLAQYDIDTARAMLKARRYLYVLFCCQQAVEKMLKALVVKETNEFPPRTHDLLCLADLAQVPLTKTQEKLFSFLKSFYIASRYPEDVESQRKEANATKATRILAATEKVLKWLLLGLE